MPSHIALFLVTVHHMLVNCVYFEALLRCFKLSQNLSYFIGSGTLYWINCFHFIVLLIFTPLLYLLFDLCFYTATFPFILIYSYTNDAVYILFCLNFLIVIPKFYFYIIIFCLQLFFEMDLNP